MIHFFGDVANKVFAVQTNQELSQEDIKKLTWLFGNQPQINMASLDAFFIGPRAAMITPWSTNATEITQNMGVSGIVRIEEFQAVQKDFTGFDPMISQKYEGLDQDIYTIDVQPESILEIDDIAAYNRQEGLALNNEEVEYLNQLSEKMERKLTDSEVFGFSQVKADVPDFYEEQEFESVISLKAETHNFPTTVEPFNGAATGSGGEIRDRLAGGKGSLPLAGTAVYMTAYSRLEDEPFDSAQDRRPWENGMAERKWLYQTPMDILIKASNGASDFGNKFGQPLITGSILTFEHAENDRRVAYDKVIMQAGGIGYGKAEQAIKDTPQTGDKIVILGGDNYRIGMGGAAVSSADTGEFSSAIELNAVQRSNPEMQRDYRE